MTNGRTLPGAVLALVVALLATTAGCGDPLADTLESSGRQAYSDDDPPLAIEATTTTAPAPTAAPDPAAMAKWTFVAEANRTCSQQNVTAARTILSRAASPQAALDALSLMTETLHATAGRLEAMTPPPGDEALVADLVGGLRHIASILEPVVAAGGFHTEQERADWTARMAADGDVVTARFDAYGLTDCF